jgi:hypothetical protein
MSIAIDSGTLLELYATAQQENQTWTALVDSDEFIAFESKL